jgi:polygalacturonase
MSLDLVHAAGAADATTALQAAIGRIAAAGGGRLTLGPGEHVAGGLRLASGVEIHLAAGAVLRPIADYAAYAATTVGVVAEDSDRAMIVARDAERIALTGPGTIEAGGAAFITATDAAMGTHVPARLRPRVLVLENCRDVRVEGLTVRRSPMWTLHFVRCRNVVVRDVRVDNDRMMPNTDGMVIDACEGVRIARADISTADDGIVLKTSLGADGRPVGACRDIRASDCRISSQSCALKLGTESHGDFTDIAFEDCAIVASNRALGLFSRDGGTMTGVRFSRITVDCHETPDGFWGSGEAITVNVVDRRPDRRPAGAIAGLVFEDITGRMQGAVNLVAAAPAGIHDLRLTRVHLEQVPGKLGTARSYDLRPGPADLAPAAGQAGRANAWVKDASGRVVGLTDYPGGMPGLYAVGIAGLVLDDVTIARPDGTDEGWNAATVVVAD